MVTWFGTLSSLNVRIQTRGLERPVFVAEVTWSGIHDFLMQKRTGWDMLSKTMKYMTLIAYRWVPGWWKCSSLYERVCTRG